MSDPGTVSPPAPAIETKWLRDGVAAFNSSWRATVGVMCGFAVMKAVLAHPDLVEIVAVGASLAGGAAFLRSLDKKTEASK